MKHPNAFPTALLAAALALCYSPAVMAQTAATATASKVAASPAACPAILQHEFPRLQDDVPQNLCQYAGKVLLVVNTASFCGFTSQYEGLEALHAKYQSKGLLVLGFPSNQFGQQEPGSSKDIADFCFNTYGVKFPMFSKSEVKGNGRNALYAALFAATRAEPKWNFHKYLVGRNGTVLASYASNVEPNNTQLVAAIEKAIEAKF